MGHHSRKCQQKLLDALYGGHRQRKRFENRAKKDFRNTNKGL
jgi:hypothetical protein